MFNEWGIKKATCGGPPGLYADLQGWPIMVHHCFVRYIFFFQVIPFS